jgi:SAM-dependent methyltransferase
MTESAGMKPVADRHGRLLREVATYYSGRLAEFGQTAQGVDWNGSDSQRIRFAQLAGLFPINASFSVIDIGCGYGAFVDHLASRWVDVEYLGVDVSADMIASARERYAGAAGLRFIVGSEPDAPADYCVASGIFNVKQSASSDEWLDYLHATLDLMDSYSRAGFAFNCLTRYSDVERMRPDLYYADPLAIFDRCKRRYSRQVALLHDYGLYEFTILVRKDL